MKVKCSYCGQFFDDSAAQCPACGAPNDHIHRTSDDIPKTIEELKAYCESQGLTPERTRFFVGVDYKEPRAFGIYKDDAGEFVVYKNKADGSRAVRYRGKDEAYAVNELYERLQSEVLNQKAHYVKRQKEKAIRTVKKEQKSGLWKSVIVGILVALGVFTAVKAFTNKYHNGYYTYNGSHYYSLDDSWYYFDTGTTDWYPASSIPDDLSSNADDYYESNYYDFNSETTDFKDTDFYSNWEASKESSYDSSDNNDNYYDDDDDWDSGWDSSDWDSGDTDWDSDW